MSRSALRHTAIRVARAIARRIHKLSAVYAEVSTSAQDRIGEQIYGLRDQLRAVRGDYGRESQLDVIRNWAA